MRISGLLIPSFAAACLAAAQTNSPPGLPKVDSLSPRGWHRGATVEVEFSGSRLNHPRGILTPDTDKIRVVKVEPVVPEKAKPDELGKSVKATLEIAPDCPTGPQWLRLWTDYGIGEVISFWVGALPTITEAEAQEKKDTNGTAETAEKLEGPKTINGFLAGTDADFFQIDAKRGAVFSAEVECARLAVETDDGTEVLLTVQDAAGKVLASCDDTPLFLADPFVSFVAPADGPLLVSIKPLIPSSAGRRLPYRLHVGTFLRPAAIFPAGGKPGQEMAARLLGLPVPDQAEVKITLPSAATGGIFPYRASDTTASPNPLRVFPGANILEQEPNPDAGQATATTEPVPLAFNGILEKDGDVDCFRFTAKKGDRLIVSGFGQALGSPIDLQLGILPATAKPGQNPDRSDDATEGDRDVFEQSFTREKLDPRFLFAAKEDGEYILTVRDSRNLGGPLFVYRVELEPAVHGVLIGLTANDQNYRFIRSAVSVGRGNRVLQLLNIRPLFGSPAIEGELELRAAGLPPGVTMEAPKFKIDQRRIPVMFTAAPDAPANAAMISFSVAPTAGGSAPLKSQFSHRVGLTYQNNEITSAAAFDRLAFAVTDAVPFRLNVSSPEVPLSRNGEILLEVTLDRDPGYTEAVEIAAENLPQGIAPQAGVVLRGSDLKTTFRLGAEGGAPVGRHQICLTARNRGLGDGRWGKMHAASPLIPVEVAEPFVRIKFPRSAVERGRKTTVTATIERLSKLPGPATLRLIRLPKGLTLPNGPATLPDSGDKVSLEIEASVDTLVGTYNNIACELAVESGGKELKQIVGGGMVRVDPQRKAQ